MFAPAHSNLFSLSFLHTVTIPPGRREEPLVYFNLNPSGWRYRGIPFCHFSQVLCVITLHLSIIFFQRTSENCLLFPFHLCVFVFGSWGMPVKSPQFCLCIILKLFSEWEEKGRGVTLSKGPQVTSGLNLSWSLVFFSLLFCAIRLFCALKHL